MEAWKEVVVGEDRNRRRHWSDLLDSPSLLTLRRRRSFLHPTLFLLSSSSSDSGPVISSLHLQFQYSPWSSPLQSSLTSIPPPSSSVTGGGASILLAVGEVGGGAGSRLRSWQHSLRIIRVSRASGGKDRHSKVWTAKGPRDRRVRLSVTTAIQFYDLQDRLGFDQPSKAVEWLIKAAADSIAELPALNGTFPETPRQLDDEKRSGSDQLVRLSLSRTEIRAKACERARVRTTKEKDK